MVCVGARWLNVCHFKGLFSKPNFRQNGEMEMLGTILLIVLILATRGRIPCLATQQGVGILSKRWHGTGPFDRARAPVNGPYLTGVMASQRNAQHSLAMGHGPATVNTKLL